MIALTGFAGLSVVQVGAHARVSWRTERVFKKSYKADALIASTPERPGLSDSILGKSWPV